MSDGKLLGDQVEELSKTLGLDRLARQAEHITGKPCKCNQRKQFLNELHERVRRRIRNTEK